MFKSLSIHKCLNHYLYMTKPSDHICTGYIFENIVNMAHKPIHTNIIKMRISDEIDRYCVTIVAMVTHVL